MIDLLICMTRVRHGCGRPLVVGVGFRSHSETGDSYGSKPAVFRVWGCGIIQHLKPHRALFPKTLAFWVTQMIEGSMHPGKMGIHSLNTCLLALRRLALKIHSTFTALCINTNQRTLPGDGATSLGIVQQENNSGKVNI